MIKLHPQDRIRIAKWLSEIREFEAEASRRRLLELAGLEAVAPQIDLSGAPLIAAASLIDFLARYGRPTHDAEALGLLLNLTATLVSPERHQEISDILRRYAMITPAASAPVPGSVPHPLKPDFINEKIIGQNTLRTIAFLARGLRASRPVGLVKVNAAGQSWYGSGFLVAEDLLLTNSHVVGSPAEANGATVLFDFEEDEYGRHRQPNQVSVVDLICSDATLDYAILSLKGTPGQTYGWLPLESREVAIGERVNIIQHPGGQPKQVALQNNLVEFSGGNVVQYVTSTLPGSSGSPVFNDAWEVVAVHHAGGWLTEPTSGQFYYRNEGISISAILDDLPDSVRGSLNRKPEGYSA